MYEPAVTDGCRLTLRVDVFDPSLGGVTGFGLKVLLNPPGGVAERFTADEKVSIEPTVRVDVPEPPTAIVIGLTGFSEKSGTITVKFALPLLFVPTGSSGEESETLAPLLTTVPRLNPEFNVPVIVIVAEELAASVE